MSEIIPLLAEQGEDYGPAMKALIPQHRAFVLAYCTNGADATQAAREAGYVDNKNGSIRVTAHRTLHRKDVLAAIREMVIGMTQADLPIYRANILKIAQNDQHKDVLKANLALADRGGMPAVTERNVNITVTMTTDEKVAKLRALAEQAGLDPSQVLGVVDLAPEEFTEVKPEDEEQW